MKKHYLIIVLLLLSLCSCTSVNVSNESERELAENYYTEETELNNLEAEQKPNTFDISAIPEFSGSPYVEVNNNIPYFDESDYTTEAFEKYSQLDELERCGVAFANICKEIMPAEERGNIGMVKPTGWHIAKYDNVDGKYLYNRCHLIGYQLAGENANVCNLITGTRYLNVQGMLPFEDKVADYVERTNNHVLYRVTPIFEEDNLLATGVLMEAYSVEDNGKGIAFNVFCYNAQPDIKIDYATGDSFAISEKATQEETKKAEPNNYDSASEISYIGNKNTKKFHLPSCSSVAQMKDKNKVYMECTKEEAIAQGYEPCQRCNP